MSAYRTINPATGEVVKSFDTITDDGLSDAIATADAAYQHDWRNLAIRERADIVRAVANELRENASEHARIITTEVGKLIGLAEAEVGVTASILDYYADRAESFLAPRDLPESPGATVEISPIGIILAIEPWNFPYYQLARVVGPQLVAGNVVMAKHAESVPQSALAFAQLFEAVGAPKGVYTNIFASIDQVGTAIDDPRIAAVTLTGSERAGSAVAERAGRSLKKVVMELGGSDPFIVLDDAALEHAVQGAVFGRMFNTGQSCNGSKRIIVVGRDRGEQFLSAFADAMAGHSPGDPSDPDTVLGPMSSERALDSILAQIRDAVNAGAKVVTGGNRISRDGFYIEPTVLTDIDSANPGFDTEFFGPVAAFYIVDSEDEAIKLANATRFGLGASIFTANVDRGRKLAAQIDSGMVFINQPAWTAPELPFGGTKASGFGRELSEMGIGEFVNHKVVNVAPAGAPPWGPAT